jgi:hypothetical protein
VVDRSADAMDGVCRRRVRVCTHTYNTCIYRHPPRENEETKPPKDARGDEEPVVLHDEDVGRPREGTAVLDSPAEAMALGEGVHLD